MGRSTWPCGAGRSKAKKQARANANGGGIHNDAPAVRNHENLCGGVGTMGKDLPVFAVLLKHQHIRIPAFPAGGFPQGHDVAVFSP